MRGFNSLNRRLLVALCFLIPPLLLLAPVTLGSRTLLPVDNLISYEPWTSVADDFELKGPESPHNLLLSDLILENYVWKRFISQAIEGREIPLWNPYLFAGVPFLAAGQHSMLYPFSVIFYLLPLDQAYGWFMLSQYFLSGLLAYLFIRALGIGRWGGIVGGLTYQLSLFMVVSAVFPMIVAGTIWLPLLLLAIELIISQRPLLGRSALVPWMCLGAVSIAMQLLAGHPEIIAYSIMVGVAYGAWRFAPLVFRRTVRPGRLILLMAALAGMLLLGILLGAVQFVPQLEAANGNFRSEVASLDEVRGWGYPLRRLITFLVPNFFGNPSHHGYFDLFTWQWTQASVNASSDPIRTIDWGIKNYVEGGSYVGILPLLLSGLGIWFAFHQRHVASRMWRSALFFGLLSLACLAFVFGTPLYSFVYYLPGLAQLHTPFRWVWPFSLCIAVLASFGSEAMTRARIEQRSGEISVACRRVALGSLICGVLLMFGVIFGLVAYGSISSLMQRLVEGLALAQQVFVDGRAFFSYEALWLLQLCILLIVSGLILWKLASPTFDGSSRRKVWYGLMAAVVAADLLLAGVGFNSSVNTALLDYSPPVVDFLRKDESEWRFTTYDPEGEKYFNANSGWLFDFEDVRGYDSIIPRQYAEYMALIEPQSELQYNRIAPISDAMALDSPLLDLLNVKYVVTMHDIENSDYTLVYDSDLQVYRNDDVMPRAFTLPVGCAFESSDFGATIKHFDPRRHVSLDPGTTGLGSYPSYPSASCQPNSARITSSSLNQVVLEVHTSEPSFLILSDSYSEGWRAYVRPVGTDEVAETRIRVLRANGNFRAIGLEPGDHAVRFNYSPDSVKLGGLASAMAVIATFILLGVWIWRLFYRESAMKSKVRRVAKNSLTPMAFNLVNRSIDFVFAMFYLRALGPGDAGNYATAIVIVGWFDILTNFGLNTWLTREASRDRDHANRYLSNSTVLRLALGGLTFPVFVGAIFLYQRHTGALGNETVVAIMLLAFGMLFSSISTGLSALFYAYEKAEHPAAITSGTTFLKVAFGTIAIMSGYGFIGLAGVTIVVNVITMVILIVLARRILFKPRLELDPALQRQMVFDSFPLMLNHLLATLFFRIDIPMIRAIRGESEVGRYGAAYKFVDAFNIIPAFFTFALFPIMSQQAKDDRLALARTYHLAIKLLVGTALPLALISTFLAKPMVGLLGGREFLPDGALALQLMVWSIPFGWINSVTNYLLVAVGQQRALTRAFAIAVTFNIVINAIFIPQYGLRAAAISTILSEIVIGAAFQWFVYRHLSPTPWVRLLWRLAVAICVMVVVTWLGSQLYLVLGLILGCLVYLASVLGLGVFSQDELRLLSGILPDAVRRPATKLKLYVYKLSVSMRE